MYLNKSWLPVVCIMLGSLFFHWERPNTIKEEPEFREVVRDGVTYLEHSSGNVVILDSDSGFCDVEVDGGETIREAVPTPVKRFRAVRFKDATRYAARRNQRFAPLIDRQETFFSTRISDLIVIVDLLSENRFEPLKLTKSQEDEVNLLLEQYHEAMSKTSAQNVGNEAQVAYARLQRRATVDDFSQRMTQVLKVKQLKTLSNWSPARIGIVKAVTETPLGSAIDLDPEQSQQLRRRIDKVAEKLKADVREARQQILVELESSLSEKQLEKLDQQLKPLLDSHLNLSSPRKLIEMHDYDLEDGGFQEELQREDLK